MRKQLKKIIATVLTATMAMSISVPAFANDTNYVTDTTVNIVTNEAFQDLFNSTGKARTVSDNMIVEQVAYNYTFLQQEDNPELADVTLSFIMTIGGQEYPVVASGMVNAYPLSSGDILWEGPIESSIEIDGNEYKILVGLSKLESGADIQASVTIQSIDESTLINPVVFTFGATVLTKEINDDIMNNAEVINLSDIDNQMVNAEILPLVEDSNFVKVASDYQRFKDGVGSASYAQKGIAYVDVAGESLAISIKTYEFNLDNYFKNSGYPTTMTDYFKVRLQIDPYQGTDKASIISTQNYTLGNSSKTWSSVLLSDFFSLIMRKIDVPTATIAQVLVTGLTGTVTQSYSSPDTTVEVQMGATKVAIFDAVDEGIPVSFQLGVPKSYSGNTEITYTTSIRYRTQLMDAAATSYQWIYSEANDVNKTFTTRVADETL